MSYGVQQRWCAVFRESLSVGQPITRNKLNLSGQSTLTTVFNKRTRADSVDDLLNQEFHMELEPEKNGEMNEEGRVILQCAQMFDLAICNTFFNKKDEHLITYRSGNAASVIDYILVRRDNLVHVRDCKVIPGESVATQHRLLLMEIDIQMPRKTKPRHREKKIKWWNLKKDEYKMKFLTSMSDESWCDMEYKDVENRILDIAKSKLGESCPGGRYVEKETWWWTDQIHDATTAKKKAFKKWQISKEDEDKEVYKTRKKECKKAVAIAKDEAYAELYEKLDSPEGNKIIYKLSKTRNRRTKDICDNIFINDKEGKIQTDTPKITDRWQEYFTELLNETNPRKELEECEETYGPISNITLEEVRTQLKRMKTGKACGPDQIPIEVWTLLGDEGLEYLLQTMNAVIDEGMPLSWRKSEISPLFKGKGSVLECGNYRGIKLMAHTMKLYERIIDRRIREIVELDDIQFGFRKGRSTTEPIFTLRILQEKYREKGKYLHMVFVDLEKAFDRVPRDLIWWSMRKKGIPEQYVAIIQDMYKDTQTRVKTRSDTTEYFDIEVGLHQGSALSPLLFIIVMDVLASEVGTRPPWGLLFADDLALCAESSTEVEDELEKWRRVLEENGLKINRKKTEYLRPRNCQDEIFLLGERLPVVDSFKYLGSTLQAEGGCEKDVTSRIQSGWNRWREMSGVICDKKVLEALKNKIYKTAIRPAMTYGGECWPIRKSDQRRINTTEMKMLRWMQGKTRKDHIRNTTIRENAHVQPINTFLTKKRLSWFGHVQRREEHNIAKYVLATQVPGSRPRGRPKLRWMDRIKQDMKENNIRPECATDRESWFIMIQNVNPTT